MKYVRIFVVVLFVASLGIYGISRVVEENSKDLTKPVITSDREVLEISCGYTQEDLLEGLTASDEKDGDLTDQIMAGTFSQFLEKGVCSTTYVVFDSSNQSASLTRRVKFTDYESPKFTLTQPLVFQAGAGSSAVSQVGAEDLLDGDISSLVKLVDSTVNYQTAGDYSIQVEVTNSFGDVCQASLPVHIREKSGSSLEITLTDALIYLKPGTEFDPLSYVESVNDQQGTALDNPDVEASSNVDTDQEGCYEVGYTVSDGRGHEGETWLVVIVRQ